MTLFISSEKQKQAEFTHVYEVSGKRVYSQQPIALIEPFKVSHNLEEAQPFSHDNKLSFDAFDLDSALLIYQGEGSFSGGMRMVTVWESDGVQLLKVGAEYFSLTNLSTGRINLLGEYQSNSAQSAEVLMGPPLLALLAKQSIFCLHAGAVQTDSGTAVFIGESGKGKSTLSQDALEQNWHRLGDDIMPVALGEKGVTLIPRFPQLKRQRQHLGFARKPLTAIFRLVEPAGEQEIGFQSIKGGEAVITLARHTAASRVFNAETLSNNMGFNQKMAKEIPIYNLSYPRDFGLLEEVRRKIADVMAEALIE